MTREEKLNEVLENRVDALYKEHQARWAAMEPTELIGMAKKIAAIQSVYEEMGGSGYREDIVELLLQADDPLELVSNEWLAYSAPDLHTGIDNVLYEACGKIRLGPQNASVSDPEDFPELSGGGSDGQMTGQRM